MSFTAFKYADNNEKISFRKIERLQNKIIKLKCHLQFNETCIVNKMLPTYTKVNLHDDAARNEEFVLEFRLNFIKRQIEEISGKLKKKTLAQNWLLQSKIWRTLVEEQYDMQPFNVTWNDWNNEQVKLQKLPNTESCALYMEDTFSWKRRKISWSTHLEQIFITN